MLSVPYHVASVIAVLQLTVATVSLCYGYDNGIKSASKDKKIINQLHGLLNVLHVMRMCTLIENDGVKPQLPVLIGLLNGNKGLLAYWARKLQAEIGAQRWTVTAHASVDLAAQAQGWWHREDPLASGSIPPCIEFSDEHGSDMSFTWITWDRPWTKKDIWCCWYMTTWNN